MRINKKVVAGLLEGFSEPEQLMVPSWPLAKSYRILSGQIYADDPRWILADDLQYYDMAWATFGDPDLFLSFARLGARGEPSENSILQWVSKHGLLRRKNEEQGALIDEEQGAPIESEVNQAPISVADFRAEVLCAHQLLTLYTEIRMEDLEALEARVYDTDSKRHKASYWPHTPTTDLEHLFVLRREAAREARIGWRLKEELFGPDESEWNDVGRFTVWMALIALQEIVKTRIAEVRLAFDMNWTGHQPLGSDYRIPRSWDCPDLLSMMYLQFYLLITDFEPMRYCENPACGMPFPATPKNKRFCNATCRSNARHYR